MTVKLLEAYADLDMLEVQSTDRKPNGTYKFRMSAVVLPLLLAQWTTPTLGIVPA